MIASNCEISQPNEAFLLSLPFLEFFHKGSRQKLSQTASIPDLLEPIRVINPFPLRAARTRVIVRWDFLLFSLQSIPHWSSRALPVSSSVQPAPDHFLMVIYPAIFRPDNGDLFRSILENSDLEVRVGVFIFDFDPQLHKANRFSEYRSQRSQHPYTDRVPARSFHFVGRNGYHGLQNRSVQTVRKRSGIHNADPVREDVDFVLDRKIITGMSKTVDHASRIASTGISGISFRWIPSPSISTASGYS